MRSRIFNLIIISTLLVGCSALNKKAGLQDDNFFEETLEAAIQYEVGVKVDLSPDSPE